MDVQPLDVESYKLGRREAVTLMLQGSALGLLLFSGVSDMKPFRKYLPHNIVLPEYYGEDIEITKSDERIRKDEESIVERMVKVLPRSKPYINDLVGGVHAYSAIFTIPLEIAGAQFDTESGFNPLARSPVFALGIAQFMRDTAAGHPFYMKTYNENTHPVLYDLEIRILAARRQIGKLEKEYKSFEDKEDFRSLPQSLHDYHHMVDEKRRLEGQFKTWFAATVTPENDERIKSKKSIHNGILCDALLGATSKKNFSGNYFQHLFRAMSGYNAGVKKSNMNPVGIALNNETNTYRKDIARKANMIMNPNGWMAADWEMTLYARGEHSDEHRLS